MPICRTVALALILLSGCIEVDTDTASAPPVESATAAWAAAYNGHNPADVLARYAPDAVFWGTTSPVIRDNPAAIAEYFQGLSNRPNAHVTIAEQHPRLVGELALNSGVYVFTDVADGEPVTRPSRFSFAYRLVDGEWLIIDHHSSRAPGG